MDHIRPHIDGWYSCLEFYPGPLGMTVRSPRVFAAITLRRLRTKS